VAESVPAASTVLLYEQGMVDFLLESDGKQAMAARIKTAIDWIHRHSAKQFGLQYSG
jgi:hypothetical protein